MNKVLVTGINGFIGSNIASFYRNNGFKVFGIDLFPNENGFESRIINLNTDELSCIWDMVRPDIVFHCAGMASVPDSIEDPEKDMLTNVNGFQRLLLSMYANDLKSTKVVFLSSAGVYGQPKELPINERSEISPISPYALHKHMAEEMCLFFNKYYGFDIRIARVFSAYGPGLKKQLLWDIFKKASLNSEVSLFGTGNESRDFIYIDDLVRALSLIASCEGQNIAVWNVANGKEITISQIATLFEDNFKQNISISFSGENREGDPINWCANIDNLLSLGYSQEVEIEEGIKRYIAWANDKA